MLIAIQIPFTDARPFLEKDVGTVPFPNWGDPDPHEEFVRHFGGMYPRIRGGLREWPSEGKYCELSRAIHFKSSFGTFDAETSPRPTIAGQASGKMILETACAFRRFLADGRFGGDGGGSVASRLEVGIAYRHKRESSAKLDAWAVIGIIQRALDTRVRFANGDPAKSYPLIGIGSEVGRLYLHATTRRSILKVKPPEEWWFTPSSPLVIVEYRGNYDISELPTRARVIPGFETTGIQVAHMWFPIGKGKLRCGIWFLGHNAGPLDKTTKDSLRRLRLNLFRLHSERESIKQIFSLVGKKKIQFTRGEEPSERFQLYLSQALSLLSREQRDGLPASAILEAAQNSEDLVTEGEETTLKEQLIFIRRNLRKKLHDFAEAKRRQRQIFVVKGDYIKKQVIQKMSTQTITISGSTITGTFAPVVADTIEHSFNRVEKSGAKAEMKTALESLHKAVAEMCNKLPEAKQEEASSDLEILSKEAVSKEPRRKWYELSASGLVEAAKAVGGVAAPVIEAVKAVLGLLP